MGAATTGTVGACAAAGTVASARNASCWIRGASERSPATRVALILAVAACGQMYRKPDDPQPAAAQPDPQQQQFAPSAQSGPPSGAAPSDPYTAEAPPAAAPEEMAGGAKNGKTIAQCFARTALC